MSGAGRSFTLIDTRTREGDTPGLCTLNDADLWDGDDADDALEAAARCRRCPIRDACLTNALNEEGGAHRTTRAGIRGGLNGAERESLWRKLHRKPVAA